MSCLSAAKCTVLSLQSTTVTSKQPETIMTKQCRPASRVHAKTLFPCHSRFCSMNGSVIFRSAPLLLAPGSLTGLGITTGTRLFPGFSPSSPAPPPIPMVDGKSMIPSVVAFHPIAIPGLPIRRIAGRFRRQGSGNPDGGIRGCRVGSFLPRSTIRPRRLLSLPALCNSRAC